MKRDLDLIGLDKLKRSTNNATWLNVDKGSSTNVVTQILTFFNPSTLHLPYVTLLGYQDYEQMTQSYFLLGNSLVSS